MKKSFLLKKFLSFLIAAALASAAFSGCSSLKNNESSGDIQREVSDTVSETPGLSTEKLSSSKPRRDYSDLFSARDKNQKGNEVTAEITLDDSNSSIDGGGAEISGSDITITAEGVYRISGKLTDGQIIIDAPGANVQLILDNADISCSDSAAIYGVDSHKIFITSAEDSVNYISDSMTADTSEESSDQPDSCIFSRDSITLNGLGTINVKSASADGIHSKDDIVITGGNISVDSGANGIKGKDYVAVCGGDITISSGSDGLKSTNSTDSTMGFVYIENSSFSITSVNDGIQAETDLVIRGGNISVKSGGGSENAAESSDFGDMTPTGGFNRDNMPEDFDPDNMTPPGGFDRNKMPEDFDPDNMTPPGGFDRNKMPEDFDPDTMTPPGRFDRQQGDMKGFGDGFGGRGEGFSGNQGSSESSESMKGLKAGISLDISGGLITVDSSDDALHSNGDVLISGGNILLSSGDDGIHGDSLVSISGGVINITTSYEGIESAVIDISGGITELTAKDDGLNASDGTAQFGMGTHSSGVSINISGGSVYVDAGGDGLDSNGDMTISGGTILVNGPVNSGNGALDCNGEITVDGGLLIAAGSSGMAEYPGQSSSQYSLSANFESSQSAGTLVTLLDSKGNELVSFAPAKTFANIVISSPDIQKGRSYTLSVGGSSASEETHGLYLTGGYNNDGESAGSFTADAPTSFIGQQSMMGGGFGGHGGRGDFQPPTNENGQPVMPGGSGKPFRGGRGGNSDQEQPIL